MSHTPGDVCSNHWGAFIPRHHSFNLLHAQSYNWLPHHRRLYNLKKLLNMSDDTFKTQVTYASLRRLWWTAFEWKVTKEEVRLAIWSHITVLLHRHILQEKKAVLETVSTYWIPTIILKRVNCFGRLIDSSQAELTPIIQWTAGDRCADWFTERKLNGVNVLRLCLKQLRAINLLRYSLIC